jgi:hypothetical protein
MRPLYFITLLSMLIMLALPVEANLPWTSAPLLLPEITRGADRRSQSGFRTQNMGHVSLQDYPSTKGLSIPKELNALGDGSFIMKIDGKNQGNYHWLTAVDEQGSRFASTVHYFANPGPAPRQMLRQSKLPLEIKPLDLPREHQRFCANENWDFIVLAEDKPVADVQVNMDTSNGTRTTLTTNAYGIITVNFPDDFAAFAEKHKQHDMGHASHGRKSSNFVLSVEYDNKVSAFNYQYGEDAFTNKLILPAVGMAFGGSLITGLLVFRRRPA